MESSRNGSPTPTATGRRPAAWAATLAATGLVAVPATAPAEGGDGFRTLTSSDGRQVEAKFLSATGSEVTIVTRDGREFTLELGQLSDADRTAVAEWRDTPRPAADPSALNAAVGHELFSSGGGGLWTEDPKAVAGRLKWRRESETPRALSFRSYPNDGYRFLCARPFSAALYGSTEAVTGLSLVYANKGDYFGSKGSAEDHFEGGEVTDEGVRAFGEAMEADEQAIAAALTEVLGDPTVQRFGEGKSRRKVERWDWNGHALLLSSEEGEYVSLLVQPSAVADAGGKGERVDDSVVRERIRANVERRENGDVVIANIPMVDQGPKGYCVPATFERCMRYLDIPADMYLLAMAGQSGLGGGTSVERLIDAVERDVRRKGRKFDTLSASDLRFSRLAKYIDDGIPVVWALHSTSWFNDTADSRTGERKDVSDWSTWKTKMEAAAKDAKQLEVDDVNAHVAIIIGYNKETGEVAFSDSWGERFKERWITLDEAEKHSQGRLYVVRL